MLSYFSFSSFHHWYSQGRGPRYLGLNHSILNILNRYRKIDPISSSTFFCFSIRSLFSLSLSSFSYVFWYYFRFIGKKTFFSALNEKNPFPMLNYLSVCFSSYFFGQFIKCILHTHTHNNQIDNRPWNGKYAWWLFFSCPPIFQHPFQYSRNTTWCNNNNTGNYKVDFYMNLTDSFILFKIIIFLANIFRVFFLSPLSYFSNQLGTTYIFNGPRQKVFESHTWDRILDLGQDRHFLIRPVKKNY